MSQSITKQNFIKNEIECSLKQIEQVFELAKAIGHSYFEDSLRSDNDNLNDSQKKFILLDKLLLKIKESHEILNFQRRYWSDAFESKEKADHLLLTAKAFMNDLNRKIYETGNVFASYLVKTGKFKPNGTEKLATNDLGNEPNSTEIAGSIGFCSNSIIPKRPISESKGTNFFNNNSMIKKPIFEPRRSSTVPDLNFYFPRQTKLVPHFQPSFRPRFQQRATMQGPNFESNAHFSRLKRAFYSSFKKPIFERKNNTFDSSMSSTQKVEQNEANHPTKSCISYKKSQSLDLNESKSKKNVRFADDTKISNDIDFGSSLAELYFDSLNSGGRIILNSNHKEANVDLNSPNVENTTSDSDQNSLSKTQDNKELMNSFFSTNSNPLTVDQLYDQLQKIRSASNNSSQLIALFEELNRVVQEILTTESKSTFLMTHVYSKLPQEALSWIYDQRLQQLTNSRNEWSILELLDCLGKYVKRQKFLEFYQFDNLGPIVDEKSIKKDEKLTILDEISSNLTQTFSDSDNDDSSICSKINHLSESCYSFVSLTHKDSFDYQLTEKGPNSLQIASSLTSKNSQLDTKTPSNLSLTQQCSQSSWSNRLKSLAKSTNKPSQTWQFPDLQSLSLPSHSFTLNTTKNSTPTSLPVQIKKTLNPFWMKDATLVSVQSPDLNPKKDASENFVESSCESNSRNSSFASDHSNSRIFYPKRECIFCGLFEHCSSYCPFYTTVEKRRDRLEKLGHCLQCLIIAFGSCKSRCRQCFDFHHSLICPELVKKIQGNSMVRSVEKD